MTKKQIAEALKLLNDERSWLHQDEYGSICSWCASEDINRVWLSKNDNRYDCTHKRDCAYAKLMSGLPKPERENA